MPEDDLGKQKDRRERRTLEPLLYLVGLPVASYLIFGVLTYAGLSLVGVFADPAELSVVSNDTQLR
jgi:hypothetical protein